MKPSIRNKHLNDIKQAEREIESIKKRMVKFKQGTLPHTHLNAKINDALSIIHKAKYELSNK